MRSLYPVLIIAVVLILPKAVVFGSIVLGLRRRRLKHAKGRIRPWNDLPAYMHPLFIQFEETLERLGFAWHHLQWLDNVLTNEQSDTWELVYFNAQSKSYAGLSIPWLPEPINPATVEFFAKLSDGTRFVTFNAYEHNLFEEIPNTIFIDPWAMTIEEQYEAHVAKLNEIGMSRLVTFESPEAFLKDQVQTHEAEVQSLVEKGILIPADDDCLRLTWPAALRWANRGRAGLKKVTQFNLKRKKYAQTQNLPTIDIPIDVEIEAFKRVQNFGKRTSSGLGGKIVVFVLTLVLFIVMSRFIMPLEVGVAFAGAILIHELGHYLGMLAFGYKDRRILFLPLLGAATIGKNSKATPLQQTVVFLLGPVPGLMIGSILVMIGMAWEQPFIEYFGIIMLILNYLNMLPVVPLDGGRVVELALFSRVPILKTVFTIISILVMGLGALVFRDGILTAITLFLAMSLPMQIRQNRLEARLKKTIGTPADEVSDDMLLPVIFGMLKDKAHANLKIAQRFSLAKSLLEHGLRRPPTVGVAIFCLIFYLTAFILPILVMIPTAIILALIQM